MKGLKFATLFLYGLVLVACGSSQRASSQPVKKGTAQYTFLEAPRKTTENLQSPKPRSSGNWQATKIHIEPGLKISKIYFLDDENGWAYCHGQIFRTSNSGKSWQGYPVGIDKNAEMVSMHFINNAEGWVVTEKTDVSGYSTKDEIVIYRTDDGGKTWKFSDRETAASDARIYENGGDLWLTARRFLGYNPQRLQPIILRYDVENDRWSEVTNSLKNLNHDARYQDDSTPLIRALAFKGENCVLIINAVGRIFETCNNGAEWAYVKTLKSADQVSNSVRQMEFKNDYLWILDSSGDFYHGAATLVTSISGNFDSISDTASLSDYFAGQAFPVSPEEFYLTVQKFDVTNQNPKYQGMVIHTQNGGKSWEQIFGSSNAISFAQFFDAGNEIFWILTDGKRLYRISQE